MEVFINEEGKRLEIVEQKIKDSDKVWRWTQSNINDNAANIANNINTIFNMTL